MKIIKIETCELRENPNHPANMGKLLKELNEKTGQLKEIDEGKDFVSVVFETDEGNRLYVDLTYRKNGNLGMDIVLTPQPTGKTYAKYIEIGVENGRIIKDEYK